MKSIRRFFALALALCLALALAAPAHAAWPDADRDNTRAEWTRTYYCPTCGSQCVVASENNDPAQTNHAKVWHCVNSSCADYDANRGHSKWFYTLNARHVWDNTGTCTVCYAYDASQATCSHGSYTYSYVPYNSSYHSYVQSCRLCGETISSSLQSHRTSYTCTPNNSSTHSYAYVCTQCGDTTSSGTAVHSWSISYSPYSSTQHRISQTCTGCSYGSSSYAAHTDSDGDGRCDSCSYSMSATITWDLGDGETRTSQQNYGENLVLPTQPQKDGYTFLGWFTAQSGGTQVTGDTVYTTGSPTTYYARWERISVFSVTVPATLLLTVDERGEVYAASNAEIVNRSTAAVQVTGITVSAVNGWTLVPYDTDMAEEKVDSQLIGFSLNGVKTSRAGGSETLALSGNWTVSLGGTLPLSYDAVVSALSQPVDEQVVSILFVLAWA